MLEDTRIDEELMQACQSGEKTAFDCLAERYSIRLRIFALKILEREEDAEDAVQETWLGAWENLQTFLPTHKFSTWIYNICRNKCYDILRQRYRKLEVPYPEKVRYDPSDVMETNPIWEVDFGKIKSGKLRKAAINKASREWCLAVLNHRQRLLYKLVMVEGRAYESILQEKEEFCPVPKGQPLEIKEEELEKLRKEFAGIMDIVRERAHERLRRDLEEEISHRDTKTPKEI